MLYLIYIYNGCNVLCSLSAGGLLWVRNSAQKGSVRSVSSVRERNVLRERRNSPHDSPIFYFSQKNTEEQNIQAFTETLSQPISQNVTDTEASPPAPLRMERGSEHRDTPTFLPYVKQLISYH